MKTKTLMVELLKLLLLWIIAMLLVHGVLVAEDERGLAFYIITLIIGFGFYAAYQVGKDKHRRG
jgi:hypothetical protein